MKGKLFWLFFSLLVLSLMAFSMGCQQPAAPAPAAPTEAPAETPAPAEPAPPAAPSVEFLSIVTGGTGGVYFPYGGGMSTVINRHISYLRATAEVTGASVENVRMITEGSAELGLIMNDVAFQAYSGEGRFEGDPQPIRTVFQMYPHHYHVVVLDNSDVKSIEGIRGKRVSIGAPGSGTEFKTDLVLTSLGIDYDEFTAFRLPFSETGDDLRDGRIDVGIWDVAAPTSSVMEITATRDIRLISFSDAEINKITSANPFYSRFEMAPGTYPGQTEPVVNPSVWNSVICNKDYPEEYVYDITKAMFENIDHLIAIHHFAKFSTPENTVEHSVAPLHPGAIRYLKEIGMDIPAHLIPPEMQ